MRRLMEIERLEPLSARLAELAGQARYSGNPQHKHHPVDFWLTPPAAWRQGKSLCDISGVLQRAETVALLQQGLRRGLVDRRWHGAGWPQYVWAVSQNGTPLEAQFDAEGSYHGYPLPEADRLRAEVLARWAMS
jgi:hypothetical protein